MINFNIFKFDIVYDSSDHYELLNYNISELQHAG